MLIYLTDSLITEDTKKLAGVEKCIRNLCIAYDESKHLLSGDYKVIEWGKAIVSDELCKMVLNKLAKEYATSAIPDDITEYIEVGVWEKKKAIKKGERKIHQVPYLFFTDNAHCQRTKIIGEDENDAELYGHILKWYADSLKLHDGSKNYSYEYEPRHGGGGPMGRTMTTIAKYDKIAIAIVDTDMRFPSDKIKNTSTCYKCIEAYREIYKKYNDSVMRLHILNAHEIENILPFDIVSELYKNNGNVIHFRALLNLGDVDLRFFDMKKGIRKNDDLSGDEKAQYYKFAERCYSNNQVLTGKSEFSKKVAETQDKNAIYPGLDPKVLENVIRHFTEKDIRNCKFELRPFQEMEWNKVGQHLLNYCIARPKEASNN